MKVFISHKQEDAQLAARIAQYFLSRKVAYYLDVIDTQLQKDGPELAEYLRFQLDSCSHLLAVLTNHSSASWWVPWEIGVATEKERYLASYVSGIVNIPEFLHKWPYLKSEQDLQKYIDQSGKSQMLEETAVLGGTRRSAAHRSSFNDFHRQLKRSLNQ